VQIRQAAGRRNLAAHRPGSPRTTAVDLTRFFCDRATCYPVVGGVLVYHDQNHMTPLFARTLGPYLERAVDAVRLHLARASA
jgi:hypothetical protein